MMKFYSCHKLGNLQVECCKKKVDENNGALKSKKETSNQVVVELELFATIQEVYNEAQESSSHDSSWILNNGAPLHMTNHKEWFTSL